MVLGGALIAQSHQEPRENVAYRGRGVGGLRSGSNEPAADDDAVCAGGGGHGGVLRC